MKSFLIVKTSAIGDVIQTFPVVEYLKRKFPDAKIDWIVEKFCADLLSRHPLIDKVYSIDTKKWRSNLFTQSTWQELRLLRSELIQNKYDAVFDLQGNTKSGLFTFLVDSKDKVGFGVRTVREKSNILATTRRYDVSRAMNVRKRYLTLVQRYFEDPFSFSSEGITLKITDEEQNRLLALLNDRMLDATPRIMVCFGSKWKNKQVSTPTLEGFLKLLKKELNCSFIFIYGSDVEREIAERLESLFFDCSKKVGGLSLPLWQALMGKVEAVIAMDSAALHLCGTTNTPSFGVFGPTKADIFHPGGSHFGFQGSCPYGVTFEKQCPKLRSCPTGSCIRDLTQEELFASFMKNVALRKDAGIV